MSITSLLLPQIITPEANGALFAFSGTNALQQTFQYVNDIYVNGVWSHREKLASESGTGIGMWNTKGSLPAMANEPITATTTYSIVPAINTYTRYSIAIGESYSYMTYSAYTLITGFITFFLPSAHPFVVGDFVVITPDASDPLNQYSGRRQITTVGTSTTFQIAVAGNVTFTNNTGRVGSGDGSPIVLSGLTTLSNYGLCKSAIDRNAFFNYTASGVTVGNAAATIGTNLPRTGWTMRTNSRLWLFNPFNASADHVRVYTYDQTGTQVGQYRFPNPLSVLVHKALYARMGPQDMTDAVGYTVTSGPATIIGSGVTSYTIQWWDAAEVSDKLTINIDRSCQPPEDPVQLLFQDQRGSYCTAVLAPHKRVIRKTDKQSFKRRGFSIQGTAPYYVSNQSHAQHTVFATDLEESFATSAVLKSKEDAAYFHELFLSGDVYEIQSDGGLLPVVVFEGKREAVNPYLLKGPIRWPVEYSYSYDQALNI